MYEGEHYGGKRTVEQMQNFVLKKLSPTVEIISREQWEDQKFNKKEWLLFLCGDSDDICPEHNSILKLSEMLVSLNSNLLFFLKFCYCYRFVFSKQTT